MTKKIELLANVSIIVVALLLGTVLVRQNLLPRDQPRLPARPQPQPGAKVQLPDVDWGSADRTLVLALSSTCRFCTESAEFYQRLAQQKSRGGLRLIAALPQPVSQGHAYLGKLGVSVDEVRQTPLDALEVGGTPTLLLVDRSGTLIASWVGKLPPEKEGEVMSRLWGERALR